MLTTIQGIYRNGKIELAKEPQAIAEGTPVIVTFLPCDCEAEATNATDAPQISKPKDTDLRAHGIDAEMAAELRASMLHFAPFWNEPGDEVYDDYDAYLAKQVQTG